MRLYVTGGGTGWPHFAQAMVEAGYVAMVQEAVDRYLATPEFATIERSKSSARDGIEAILNAGGVPVLAYLALLKLESVLLNALVLE